METAVEIKDIHFYNVGEINGNPVIYDYGGYWASPRIISRAINRIRGRDYGR